MARNRLRSLLIGLFLIHSWYPWQCCGGEDCHPVPCEQINEHADGSYDWHGIKFKTAQPSQDASCHVCVRKYDQEGLCLFIQLGA